MPPKRMFAGSSLLAAHGSGSSNASELPRQPAEKSAPRAVLRRKDADTGTVADRVGLVGNVDDIEPNRQGFPAAEMEGVTHTQIDLSIAGEMSAVRDVGTIRQDQVCPQAGAEQHIRTEARAQPQIRDAARGCYPPLVIE